MILLPLNLPHVWRQVDTLAVAMRYWQRWTVAGDAHPLWPAVLNSGDFVGYMGMELPLINILTAPLFFAGPMIGTKLAMVALFSMNILLWLLVLRTWKGISVAGIDASRAFSWLPLISVSAGNFGRFLPDTAAMLFCLAGCGLVWKNPRNLLALLLMTVGTLIKPTACVTFAIILLKPGALRGKIADVIQPAAAVALTLGYYLKVVPYLDRAETNDALFATQLRHPVDTLTSFFAEPLRIFNMIETNIFFPGATAALALMLFAGRKVEAVRKMWFVLGMTAVQFLAIAVLDGDHSLAHVYYYAGLSPLVTVLVGGLLTIPAPNSLFRYGKTLACFAVILFQLLSAQFDLRSIHQPPKADRMPAFKECEALKEGLPGLPWNQGYVFRTANHLYPKLGLCFGERTASETSAYGIFYQQEALPEGCATIRESENLRIVACQKR